MDCYVSSLMIEEHLHVFFTNVVTGEHSHSAGITITTLTPTVSLETGCTVVYASRY